MVTMPHGLKLNDLRPGPNIFLAVPNERFQNPRVVPLCIDHQHIAAYKIQSLRQRAVGPDVGELHVERKRGAALLFKPGEILRNLWMLLT